VIHRVESSIEQHQSHVFDPLVSSEQFSFSHIELNEQDKHVFKLHNEVQSIYIEDSIYMYSEFLI
jgi:hypothetical protein